MRYRIREPRAPGLKANNILQALLTPREMGGLLAIIPAEVIVGVKQIPKYCARC